jgi:hypothetical protein
VQLSIASVRGSCKKLSFSLNLTKAATSFEVIDQGLDSFGESVVPGVSTSLFVFVDERK